MKKRIITCPALAGDDSTAAQSYTAGWKEPKTKVLPAVAIKAYAFPLAAVTLLPGPFKKAMLANARYLLKTAPNRLVSAFRSNAGLAAKGKQYGGPPG